MIFTIHCPPNWMKFPYFDSNLKKKNVKSNFWEILGGKTEYNWVWGNLEKLLLILLNVIIIFHNY